MFNAGISGLDYAAHRGQAQPKGKLHFLAFLGEKRLAQEKHHQQETQPK